jgi:hypothetical protein
MLIFYRSPIFTGFTSLQGSNGDSRLLSYLNEHWYLVFTGRADWRNPSYFFPVANDLGFTDAFALFQPLYVPLRLLGLNQFTAFQVATMLLTTLGFVSCLVMLQRVAKVRFSVALAGAFTFAFANNLLLQSEHIQLYAVHFVPSIVLITWSGIKAIEAQQTIPTLMFGVALGGLSALLLFTSFYTGWFLIFVSFSLALVTGIADPAIRRRTFIFVRNRTQLTTVFIVSVSLSFAVVGLPFFITYLPMLSISQGAPYSNVLTYMPRPGDLLNLGESNLVWGWLESLKLSDRVSPGANERRMAITPWLMISAIVGAMTLLTKWKDDRSCLRLRIAFGAILTVVVLTLLTVRFGDFSLWKYIRDYVPGAEAVRAMARIQLTLNLVIISAWAIIINRAMDRIQFSWTRSDPRQGRGGRTTSLCIALTIFMVPLEQMSLHQLDELSPTEQATLLKAVPTPPVRCEAFYVADLPNGVPGVIAQIDAMLISHHTGLPTLNGYSGIYPLGWSLIEPNQVDYEAQVDGWLSMNTVTDIVCRLDLAKLTWATPKDSP